MNNLTFGHKIGLGFALVIAIVIALSAVALHSFSNLAAVAAQRVQILQKVTPSLQQVISVATNLETGQRGYIITGDPAYLQPYEQAKAAIKPALDRLAALPDSPEVQAALPKITELIAAKQAELQQTVDLRRAGDLAEAIKVVQSGQGKRIMDDLRALIGSLLQIEDQAVQKDDQQFDAALVRGRRALIYGALLAIAITLMLGVFLTTHLTRQIGEAVDRVRSSSTELKTAAAQQATGAKDQATSLSEITTTMTELVASSHQISETAQNMTKTIQGVNEAAARGDQLVQRSDGSIRAIKQQIDLIVSHMLDLNQKSRQIGGILELVNELAEQTNILAINATIEAVSAGESGKRFAVVADEIRKLADRVGGANREIRRLIEESTAAVNSTVLTTEGGAKTVEVAIGDFVHVAQALAQITELLKSSAIAVQEIELGTKQQTSAVEQVKFAIAEIAGVARQTEGSATQTLQTAAELSELSRQLLALTQANGHL